ncbi:ribosomal S17-domain-containing protein [Catenaria anguillulae PL171]|uniref:Ribosomal S17-domain-containing protein n=1 Tax=Catenaria anguillulae PL171 TaxID=765915 RepID=A0A1Y2HYL2_9FUNG|nr:ribosomal S17-domain-containing protein [Catenaria anguillulae PL171]
MGRVRTKTVKKASRVMIEKYYPRLTLDFQSNKKVASEVASISSKRLRNKIAGFTTHLMRRIQKGPVRGISFKLQEEERERKDNYVPDVSALEQNELVVDTETAALLSSLDIKLPQIRTVAVTAQGERQGRNAVVGANFRGDRGDRPRRPKTQQ